MVIGHYISVKRRLMIVLKCVFNNTLRERFQKYYISMLCSKGERCLETKYLCRISEYEFVKYH